MASRILLADDSITIQKVVNLTFADEGIEVVAVSSGDIAERRLPEVNPDLVLADIFMPGKNGYELCEAIKGNSQFRHVPVVLLVGAFEPFDQTEARRVGADAHLTKPFESRTLVETVRRLISASSRSATGAMAPATAAPDEGDEAIDALAPATPATPLSVAPVNLDFAAMMADSGAASSASPNRATGELASPAPVMSEASPDLDFVDAGKVEAGNFTHAGASERLESLEFSSNGDSSPAESALALGLDEHEMLQDFDRSGPVEPVAASQDPILLEAEAGTLLDVDISGAGEGEQWFSHSSLDTTGLDRPSGDAGWQSPANGSALGYQSPDFALHTDAYDASGASSETACATLLAVDEPLGDVLFDEGVSVNQAALSQASSNDALGLEFAEPEVAEDAPSSSTQFDLVETVAEPSLETSFAFTETSEATESLAVEETSTQEEAAAEPAAAGQVVDSAAVSHEAADNLDWTTPGAGTYSTAQLDSVVMPIDSAEYAAQVSPDQGSFQAETTEEASFTTPMWTEEEARFTPIDIEAVAVDEAPATEMSEAETGFVVSSVLADEPAASAETPAVTGAAEPAATAGEQSTGVTATSAANLSSSAIDEIVRRVLAQMSESVVREVAWEVVPDCVERVIEQLTRESISKRA